MTDYDRAKVGSFSFRRFGFILLTDRITHTDASKRPTATTIVGVNNKLT